MRKMVFDRVIHFYSATEANTWLEKQDPNEVAIIFSTMTHGTIFVHYRLIKEEKEFFCNLKKQQKKKK